MQVGRAPGGEKRGKSVTGSLWSTDAAGDVMNETETGLLFEYQLHLGTKSFSRRKTNFHGIPYGRHLHRSGGRFLQDQAYAECFSIRLNM